MNRIEKIFPETLLQLMLDVLGKSPQFKYISGTQPFLMSFNNQEYNVYVKNLSSAYFKERPDTTRAQLPNKDEFEGIKKTPNPFIFFGYDQENDVLVCWNFHIVKMRLNEKKSVSFYSRQFFQEEVASGEFLQKKLKNGDEPILFKRKDLVEFFTKIDTFFTEEDERPEEFSLLDTWEDEQELKESVPISTNPHVSNGKILKIIEQDLIDQLRSIIETNHTFEAMKIAEKYYQGHYPAMKPKDWLALVKAIDFHTVVAEENMDTEIQSEMPNGPKEELYKQQFIEFMQSQNKSSNTIRRYTRAISGILTSFVKELYASQLDSLFNTIDISLLNIWADQLLIRPDFLEHNAIHHRDYSCAFNKYIEFAESLRISIAAEPIVPYIASTNTQTPKTTELQFLQYLINKGLSENSAKYYVNATGGKVAECIRTHINPELHSIYSETDYNTVLNWALALYQ